MLLNKMALPGTDFVNSPLNQFVIGLYDYALDPLTEGLGLATSTPKRFVAFAAGTAIILWIVKPESMFEPTGDARPWKVVSDSRKASPLPWYATSTIVGSVAALFL